MIAVLCCSGLTACAEQTQAPAPAVTTYQQATELTFSAITKGIEAVDRYVPLTPSGTKGALRALNDRARMSLHIDDIEAMLPHDLSTLTRRVDLSRQTHARSVSRAIASRALPTDPYSITTISLGEELDAISQDFRAQMIANAPDPTDALSLSYVKKVKNGILVENETLLDPYSLQGAVTIALLNAEARGEDVEALVAKITEAGQSYASRNASSDPYVSSRGMYKASNAKWSGGNVYYDWGSGIEAAHKTELTAAMNDWTKKTSNAINFKSFSSQSWWHRFKTVLGFEGLITYYSPSWITAPGLTPMAAFGGGYHGGMFGSVMIQAGLSGDTLKGTTRHELGHVIGLEHEHQRWDRDNYVAVNPLSVVLSSSIGYLDYLFNFAIVDKNKTISYRYLKWTRHYVSGWWGGFHYWTLGWKSGTKTVANSYTPTPYDCLSIMHYAGLKMKVTGGAVAGCKKVILHKKIFSLQIMMLKQ